MLISTYSKLPHFDPKQPNAHILTLHDEVGLIRAIVVKVHTHIYFNTSNITHPQSGTLIIKVKRNVENHPDQGKQQACDSTYT